MKLQITLDKYKVNSEVKLRGLRDELIQRLTDGINKSRIGTKYKPITEKTVAIRVNKNPFFIGRNDHLEVLIKECEKRSNYSKFFFVCPLK
jgi:hypothetical protein